MTPFPCFHGFSQTTCISHSCPAPGKIPNMILDKLLDMIPDMILDKLLDSILDMIFDIIFDIILETILEIFSCFAHVLPHRVFLIFRHLSPMGPINELQRCPSRVWSQGIDPSLAGSRLRVFIAMHVQHSAPRQLMIKFFLLILSRFPLRKSEEKCTSAETRIPNFRLSGGWGRKKHQTLLSNWRYLHSENFNRKTIYSTR